MKDLLERVLKQLPTYLPELVSLVSRPKTTIVPWVEGAAGDLTRPLVFVSMTVAIGFLLQLPQLGKEHDFATLVAGMAVFKVLALLGFAGVIHATFLAVRGRGRFVETFSLYLYSVSPLYLALVVLEIASLGVLRAHDPAFATAARIDPGFVFEPRRFDAFVAAAPGRAFAYVLLALTNVGAVFVWGIVCWGAFRRVHDVSRGRSAFAWLATALAFFPFVWSLQFIQLGMFGASVTPLR